MNNRSNNNGLEDDEASIDEDENSDGGEVSMAGSDHGRGQRDGGNMMGGQYAGGRDDGDDLGDEDDEIGEDDGEETDDAF
ncbi:MAG: hypothetical protein WDW38_010816 [Sanguina aurantia]